MTQPAPPSFPPHNPSSLASPVETAFSTASFGQPAAPAKSTRPMWIAGIAGALLVTSMGAAYGVYENWMSNGRIAPGIVVQGQSVGGLTPDQATKRLQNRFGRMFVSVQTPAGARKLALSQLGGRPDIEGAVKNAYWYGRSGSAVANTSRVFAARRTPQRLHLGMKWDKAKMRRTMWTVATQYRRTPRNASLRVGKTGVQIVPEQIGRSLNVGATLSNLQKTYFVARPSVKAVTQTLKPRLAAADLVGRDVELGRYTTRFDSGLWGRTRNIQVAADEINGRVLMPGQVFSFNQTTGERTWDKGYRMAHIFERQPGALKSEVVDGLAGGVCQVSSTLFNAVRRSNRQIDGQLAIVERSSHSLPVNYVPSGLDATVAWPNRDFRFRNTLGHPVWVRAAVQGSRLIITMWGRVPDNPSAMQKIVDATKEDAAKALPRRADARRQARNF